MPATLTIVPPDTRTATVDTVGIAFPVEDFDTVGCTVNVSGYMTEAETFKYSRKLAGGGFLATGVGHMGWVEASLPKRIDGENWQAVDIGTGLELLADMYDECRQWCDIPTGHSFDESRVVRLDLVRDFHGLDNPTAILDGLAVIDQPGRNKVRRFADPSSNRSETLRVGPRAWGCTLYDKHVETGGAAPTGQLRFEARLHRPQLSSVFARKTSGHVRQVADLVRADHDRDSDGGASLLRATRAWFERVGFDRECTTSDVLSARIAALDLRAAVKAGLWTYLTAPSIVSSWTRPTVYKYRHLADDLNLAPVDAGRSDVIRLDFDTCQLVAA
jgi:hypothetical protein